jgi:chromosomal replication initiation ATPase DnaA
MSAVEFTEQDLERAVSRVTLGLAKAHGTAEQAAEEVAQRHGVRVREMLGPSRETHLVRARRDLYLVLRAAPFSWSYPAIARFCGGIDHDPHKLAAAYRAFADSLDRAAREIETK